MTVGAFQILIIALVIIVLFGRGRISETMGDFGKGVKDFGKGLDEDDAATASPAYAEAPALDAGGAPAASPPPARDGSAG